MDTLTILCIAALVLTIVFTVIVFRKFPGTIKEAKKRAYENDPLWELKQKIIKVLRGGPMGFSHLCVEVNNSCKKVATALKEMEKAGVVQKRKSFSDDPGFQMWGINVGRAAKFL